MLVYLMVVIVFLAELLRYVTGSAAWWPLLIAVIALLLADFLLQVYWPEIRSFLDRAW